MMIAIATSASRAIPIMLVCATWRVPFGLMPVTAAIPATITASPSHASQVMLACYRKRGPAVPADGRHETRTYSPSAGSSASCGSLPKAPATFRVCGIERSV
jgi:hypothetical protein